MGLILFVGLKIEKGSEALCFRRLSGDKACSDTALADNIENSSRAGEGVAPLCSGSRSSFHFSPSLVRNLPIDYG